MSDLIQNGECLEDLQRDGLCVIQKEKGFRFGTDAVLLSDFAAKNCGKRVLDLCTGTGVIPILLHAKSNPETVTGVEIQPDIADMARRSMAYNGLTGKIPILCANLKDCPTLLPRHSFDAVTCNPPYMKGGSGVKNQADTKTIARHELFCTLEDVLQVSAAMLRQKGRFFMVHRPARLADILTGMRACHLEPKQLRFVHASPAKEPILLLIEGSYHGGAQLNVLPPLFLYDETGKPTLELENIYGHSLL